MKTNELLAAARREITEMESNGYDDFADSPEAKRVAAMREILATLEHHADLQHTFDLQWEADQRAIKMWQGAHPGNDMVWPDRANMVVWLMERQDRAIEEYIKGPLPDCMAASGGGETCTAYRQLHAAFAGAETKAFLRGREVGEKHGSLWAPLAQWRHKERGTVYREVGLGEAQASTAPIMDGDQVYVYRGEADGKLWVRREAEFLDGRFERLAPSAMAVQREVVGADFIDIVFDGPPGPESGRFVEVENSKGASIRFGEWVHRSDGYWVIRFQHQAAAASPWREIEAAARAVLNEARPAPSPGRAEPPREGGTE